MSKLYKKGNVKAYTIKHEKGPKKGTKSWGVKPSSDSEWNLENVRELTLKVLEQMKANPSIPAHSYHFFVPVDVITGKEVKRAMKVSDAKLILNGKLKCVLTNTGYKRSPKVCLLRPQDVSKYKTPSRDSDYQEI